MSAITNIRCVLTQKALDALCDKFHIPKEVHPVLPKQNDTMHERPAGKIRLYTRLFDYANFRLPLSTFLVDVHRHFRINISQLFVIGAAKVFYFKILCRVYGTVPTVVLFRCFYNNHFFWVDDFAFPTSFLWHTAKHMTRDPDPTAADFNAQDYATLVAHPYLFWRLLARAMLNAEVGVVAIPTLPFVTTSISSTPKREDGDHTDFVAEPNLCTIRARSSVPMMTTATAFTSMVDSALVAKEKPVKPSLFSADSSSAGGADPNTGVFSDLTGSDFLVGGIRTIIDPDTDLQKFFASVRGMEHDHLFIEFNVGAARQMSLSAEKTEATEATRLRAQTSNLEAVEKSLRDELNALKKRNVILEKEQNALDLKVTDLKALVVGKERDRTDLNAQLTFVKSQNDNLADQVHELEISSAGLQEKITVYDNCMEKLEKFQDDRMKRWLLTHGLKLFLIKCLSSSAYLTALRAAISRAIEKGMQSGLADDIDHGREGKSLANVDASTENIMNVLCLEGALVDVPGMNDLQPDIEQFKENIAAQRSAFIGVWTPLSEPLSVTSLMGEASTSGVVPAASVTITALSTTFASASSIPPISIDDYEIVGVDGQEGVGMDGRAVVDGNVAPFLNVVDV
uniref:Transposase (Putative), gypsy type n=1 Tax=Tanacetum cinerariifolium TaxID=118510 RepID=A0A6L2NE12_TANCI|nr:hypothetical protein [Tanacetum cinerariifolium]